MEQDEYFAALPVVSGSALFVEQRDGSSCGVGSHRGSWGLTCALRRPLDAFVCLLVLHIDRLLRYIKLSERLALGRGGTLPLPSLIFPN